MTNWHEGWSIMCCCQCPQRQRKVCWLARQFTEISCWAQRQRIYLIRQQQTRVQMDCSLCWIKVGRFCQNYCRKKSPLHTPVYVQRRNTVTIRLPFTRIKDISASVGLGPRGFRGVWGLRSMSQIC